VLLGSTLLVNLRLLGMIRGWSVEQMAHSVSIFIHASLLLVAVTGILMFLSNPFRYYDNLAFGPKILFFAIAALYQLTLYRWVVRSSKGGIPLWARIAGGSSLLLWFAIGATGRAIGAI
ncbi:MAG TPA: DUF6644 family protein, partial [Terriglobia bacterium]|nr:DUF6644 family protein [Terriglobia bacterium]